MDPVFRKKIIRIRGWIGVEEICQLVLEVLRILRFNKDCCI